MDLTCLCAFLCVSEQSGQLPQAFAPQHIGLTLQKVLVLGLLLADLLQLLCGSPLRRYLDDAALRCSLGGSGGLLIGKIKEIVLKE